MDLHFSIIIPVYNRPQEVAELLHSLCEQEDMDFEVIVVEDGSSPSLKADQICKKFSTQLNLTYYFKPNSGAGQSRNYGMERASGNYFIILDSDCILPKTYLSAVREHLTANYTDGFGGADAAHESFSVLQKAINYVMTSVLTTGGIRGNKALKKFQPRSFNMGLSKKAFQTTGGFKKMTVGEDIDLSFRLWQAQFETQFIETAYVFHKRRISWGKFFRQTNNFGAARPILNFLFPGTAKVTYWFPSLFVLGAIFALLAAIFSLSYLGIWLLLGYLCLVFIHSAITTKSLSIAVYVVPTLFVMFFGYGLGFLRSFVKLQVLRQSPKKSFPKMFDV
ncbi:glycosyltransferase family 2 protein [Flavobacteriaceae bacterium F08102]|nr:glycosyltransferase family 2 protein [Flavobacteriaceae bacterium F08102]